jgi:hypothetical protein
MLKNRGEKETMNIPRSKSVCGRPDCTCSNLGLNAQPSEWTPISDQIQNNIILIRRTEEAEKVAKRLFKKCINNLDKKQFVNIESHGGNDFQEIVDLVIKIAETMERKMCVEIVDKATKKISGYLLESNQESDSSDENSSCKKDKHYMGIFIKP